MDEFQKDDLISLGYVILIIILFIGMGTLFVNWPIWFGK